MRWVTYLSPSGGARRPGVVDDDCVFGYPGRQSLEELLSGGELPSAYSRALDAPVEIIVELETRLCAPVVPVQEAIAVLPGGVRTGIPPVLVRGTDDGVALPAGAATMRAALGVAAFFADGRHVGSTLACLWRTDAPVALTLGPVLVTPDEAGGADHRHAVTAEVSADDGTSAVTTEVAAVRGFDTPPRDGCVLAAGTETRPLEKSEELHIDGGVLGEFEVRVGAVA